MEYQINKISNEQLDKLAIKNSFPINSLGISIPYEFFSKLAKLNWYDILFAIENGFLSYQFAIKYAISEVLNNENLSQTILDLACLSPIGEFQSYLAQQYLNELVNQISNEKKSETKNKVMYILLYWIFENKECYEDPLKVVEFIYDDFNFPISMVEFVRYMPATQPLLNTVDENIEQLYRNWKYFWIIKNIS